MLFGSDTMYIDSHLHLSSSDYSNINDVVNNALANDVGYLVISCCTLNDIDEGIKIINKYENVFMCIGLHPSEISSFNDENIKYIEETIKNNKKIVAVGEIGLDYYYGKDTKEKQIELFISQLEIASKLNMPVVIHTRDAVKDTIEILKKYNLKGVIHCFNGSLETAREYISLGYLLGIGGVITFKNSNLPLVISLLDINNLVLETDSPYLSPEPYRGKQNEPKNIPIIAKKISDIKGVSPDEVAFITSNNVIQLFDLKKFM